MEEKNGKARTAREGWKAVRRNKEKKEYWGGKVGMMGIGRWGRWGGRNMED